MRETCSHWTTERFMRRLGKGHRRAGNAHMEPVQPSPRLNASSYTSPGATSPGLPGGAGGFPVIATDTQLFSGLRRRSLGSAIIDFTNAEPKGITADLRYPQGVNRIRNCYSVDPIPHFNKPHRQNLLTPASHYMEFYLGLTNA